MAKTKLMALLTLFAALSIASIIGVYYTHQLPTEGLTSITLASYQQTGTYNYIAKLKPNQLYNQSTLGPGEGTLYIQIIDHINVTFSYVLQCSHPTNTSIQQYSVNMEIQSPEKWLKVFTQSQIQETFQLANNINSNGDASTNFTIGIAEITALVRLIDEETKTRTTSFSLNVKPEIHTLAETDVGTIIENFNPTLTIKFNYGTQEGDYISMEDLQQTTPGTLRRNEQVFLQSTIAQRFITYAMAIASLAGLALTTWAYVRVKPPTIRPVEEVIAPHEEIVIDVAGEPSYKGQEVTVPMNSLEDLIKLADGLDKPVFHLKKPAKTPDEKPTHVFYVLDGLTRYEYEAEAP